MSGTGLAGVLEAQTESNAQPNVSLLLETEGGRAALIEWARLHLPLGECLVEAKDLAGQRRAFTTMPSAADAELVATTVPRLLRGRLLATSTFYRVRSDQLHATEKHYENGRYSHSYQVTLKPVVRGSAGGDLPMIPA